MYSLLFISLVFNAIQTFIQKQLACLNLHNSKMVELILTMSKEALLKVFAKKFKTTFLHLSLVVFSSLLKSYVTFVFEAIINLKETVFICVIIN